MKTRSFALVAIVLVAVIGLAVLGGCKKDEPVEPEVTFANTKCPIMTGNTIDPAKVTPELTAEFKGEKVAFCCAVCPEKWDALSEEDKIAKLAAVK